MTQEAVAGDHFTAREEVRVLLLLTFAAGCLDAIAYLGLGRVFCANMTGNFFQPKKCATPFV